MSTTVKLGSRRSLRLPDEILDAAGVTRAVTVELRGTEVVLRAVPDDQVVEAEVMFSESDLSALERIKDDFDHEDWEWPSDFAGLRGHIVSKPIS